MSLPWAEPFAAALALRDEPGLVLLESMPGFGALGRRSYLAARPAEVATDGIADARAPRRGLVGGLALVRPRARDRALPVAAADDLGLPPLALGRYEAWLEFDHDAPHRADPRRRRRRAPAARAARAPQRAAAHAPVEQWDSSLPRPAYEQAVAARDRLHPRGRRLPGEPLAAPQHRLGRRSRSRSTRGCGETSPAPFMALVRLGGADVISASPERFLRRARRAHRDAADQGHAARAARARARTARMRSRCARARRTAPRT